MWGGKAKRVIILKNLSSDFIEKAIIVLKNDKKSSKFEQNLAAMEQMSGKNLVREAEEIINNYIRNSVNDALNYGYENLGKSENVKTSVKPSLKIRNAKKIIKNAKINFIINFSLICSIVLVSLLIFKALNIVK